MIEVEGGSRAAASKGSMTYAITHMGNFLLLLLAIEIYMPWGWDSGLRAGIWALGLGLGAQGWDLGLKAEIWALRLGFGPQCWDLGLKARI